MLLDKTLILKVLKEIKKEEKFIRKVDVISKPALKEDLRENILQEVIYE